MTLILRIPYSALRFLYERTSFHKSVIEDIPDASLKLAYSHCRAITRFYAKTFYMATRFLPNEKQRSIFAIYGLCRYLDNLVDECEDIIQNQQVDISEVNEKLDAFIADLKAIYNGEVSTNPILIAFSDTIQKYDIPIDLPLLLIDGLRSDLMKTRFATFQELYDYSYKVASVVGLMISRVFGYSKEEALGYAIELGIAMQLTNILRDIGEDLHWGRIYIPQDELKQFNLTEAELFSGHISNKFIELMKFQIERARSFYEKADIGISMLAKDSRIPVYLARYNYEKILDKIEAKNYNVFNERAYLNNLEKFTILPRIFAKMRAAS